MDFIKLLDVANPKKIKDTINLLIENYEDFGDTVQAIADKAAEDSAAALLAGNEAKQIAQQNTEDLEEAIASQNTTIQQNKAEQDATIEAAFEVQDAKLNAQDEEIAQNTTTSDQAKQIAEEALAMIEQADARSLAATETAEDALALANESIETSELAMNVATDAKSTVDQAISTGVFGTFVHNPAGVSLLHAYMTDNLNQENTDENFYMATPKLVRDALTNYYTKDEAAAKTDIPTEYLTEVSTNGSYSSSSGSYTGITITNSDDVDYGIYFNSNDFTRATEGGESTTGYMRRLYRLKDVVRTTDTDQEIAGIKNYTGGLQKNSVDVATVNDIPTTLSELTEDTTHRLVTDTEKAAWNAKSDFSGSYSDLTDKPTIPTTLAELTADSTHRLVTDTEKSTWNSMVPKTATSENSGTTAIIRNNGWNIHSKLSKSWAEYAEIYIGDVYNSTTPPFYGDYNSIHLRAGAPITLEDGTEASQFTEFIVDGKTKKIVLHVPDRGAYVATGDQYDDAIGPSEDSRIIIQSDLLDYLTLEDIQPQLNNMVTLNTEQTITAPKNTQLSINWTDNIDREITLNKEIIVDNTDDHEITEKTTRHYEWNGSDGTGHITWTDTQESKQYKKEISLVSNTASDQYFYQTITQYGAFNLRSYYNNSTGSGTRYARFEFNSNEILIGYRNGSNNYNLEIDNNGINFSVPNDEDVTINGVPIIESGSNANGYYTKFADGTLICYGNKTISNYAMTINYPAIFIDTNYSLVTQFVRDESLGNFSNSQGLNTMTTTNCVCYSAYSETATVLWIAIGRWK